ncbi:MAG: hypothetical protein ACOYXB_07360 [Bacteroidota bacterium]
MRKAWAVLVLTHLAVILTAQTTFNWVPRMISDGNNLQRMAIMPDSSVIVIGANGVFQKSSDRGKTWFPVKAVDATFDFISLSINEEGIGWLSSRRARFIDYTDINDAVTDGKLLKTTDYGTSWTPVSLSSFSSSVLATNPNRLAAYALDPYAVECVNADTSYAYVGWYDILTRTNVNCGALFMTADGGTSWNAISGDLGNNIVKSIHSSGKNTYFGGDNTFLRKTGDEITDLFPALVAANNGDENIFINDIELLDDRTFYLITTTDGLYFSDDAGATISKLEGTNAPAGGIAVTVPGTGIIMVLGTSSNSLVSTNNGASWVNCYPGTNCWEIGGVMNDSVIALAKNGLYKIALSDLGSAPTNWKNQTITDQGSNLFQMVILDSDRAILAGAGELASFTTDKGLNWSPLALPELYQQGDPGLEYPVDFNSVSVNDGVSYVSARRFRLVDFPADSTQKDIYVPGPVFRSFDNWESWELLDIDEVGKESPDDISINAFNPDCDGFEAYTIENISDSIIYIYNDWFDNIHESNSEKYHARVFRSKDGGSTWHSVSEDFGTTYITDISFDDHLTGYYAGSKVLRKTSNGGDSFTDLYPILDPDGSLAAYIKKIVKLAPDTFCLPTTKSKLWIMTNGGSKFEAIPGLIGANDFIKLDVGHMMAMGAQDKCLYTRDTAQKWQNCYPGSTVWDIGGIVNDSIYVLTKGNVYIQALYDLIPRPPVIIIEGTDRLSPGDGWLKILNRHDEIEVLSSDDPFRSCMLINLSGQVLEEAQPGSNSCIFSKTTYPAGVYIILAGTKNKTEACKVIF